MSAPSAGPRCWCGATALEAFEPEYLRCPACGTLVCSVPLPGPVPSSGTDDGFYGKDYWSKRQAELGDPDIGKRAVDDLPERCAHWLATLAAVRPPPARVLEIGCGHGGFAFLASRAGYDARGLDMCPYIAGIAREAFGLDILVGPLERQGLAPGSFDAVAMMDVLEHLPDPAGTMKAVAALLAPGGVVIVQTPLVPDGPGGARSIRRGDSILGMLRAPDHQFLFTRAGLDRLLSEACLPYVRRERAIHPQDQYAVASAAEVPFLPPAEARSRLARTPDGRLVEALLAATAERDGLAAALEKRSGPLAWLVEEVKRQVRKRRYRRWLRKKD